MFNFFRIGKYLFLLFIPLNIQASAGSLHDTIPGEETKMEYVENIPYSTTEAEKGTRQSYNTYKRLLSEEKYDSAANYIDSATVNFFGRLLEPILYADSAKVSSMLSIEKYFILYFRYRVPKAQLTTFTPSRLMSYILEKEILWWNDLEAIKISRIEYDTISPQVEFNRTAFQYRFYLQKGYWKMNLMPVVRRLERNLATTIKDCVSRTDRPRNADMCLELVIEDKMYYQTRHNDPWKPVLK